MAITQYLQPGSPSYDRLTQLLVQLIHRADGPAIESYDNISSL